MANVKTAFVSLALVLLSACNMVVSEKPWFAAASGPQLKDGLWANLDTPDCVVDPAKTLAQWPECAQPMMIRGNAYSGPPVGTDPAAAATRFDTSKWQPVAHVLADGTPQIDQIFVEAPAGAEDAPVAADRKAMYLYIAVKPIVRDAAGRIIETQRWPVLCGPMPKNSKDKNGKPNFTTNQPFAGLTVVEAVCTAKDPAALRSAAAQSEGLAQAAGFTIITSRWVGDAAK